MRIVGGTLSGRKIEPPTSLTTRPMMDRIRQALFNILEHHDWGRQIGNVVTDAHVLDGFCGTGALGLEAISRGATEAYMFDNDSTAVKTANQNATTLGIQNQCRIFLGDALAPPTAPGAPCKLVFLAPPYRKNLIPPALLAYGAAGWIDRQALIVAETAKKEPLELPPAYTELFFRSYGDTMLHFVSHK
jgi:16S rRNA (guanine966-N2)-methyltransferase